MENFEQYLNKMCYDRATIKEYLFFNGKILHFADKPSKEITRKDIEQYLLYLVEHYGARSDTINLALFALISYYRDFTRRQLSQIPLTREDVVKIIEVTKKPNRFVNIINTVTGLHYST